MSQSNASPIPDNIGAKGCNSGRPLSAGDLTNSAIRRFCSRLIMRGGDQCWDWSGSKDSNGYGRIHFAPEPGQRRCELIHRIGYAIHHGPIPAGMVVMHTCDNPSCVNPKHLRLATQAENLRDRDAKGRHRHNPSLFSPEQVERIAADYAAGMTLKALGTKYGANFTTIRNHLMRHNVPMRPKGRYPHVVCDQIKEAA